MDEVVPFRSWEYVTFVSLLLFARGMDFLSTWLATPNLVLEANPIAKKLGWKWGIPVNVALCGGFGFFPLPAIIIATTSILVAARNFQGAWLMRTAGEFGYRAWMVERMEETPIGLFLGCLFAQTLLVGAVGGALIIFSANYLVPVGIGLGLVGYAIAVVLFTLLALWRSRRAVR
jgi:hypothetical protein